MFFCIFTVCINWIYSAFTSCCVTYEKNFTAWSTMCVVWLLDPAFLMLRVRIENDSNSNSNQVLLNIYQVNILLSLILPQTFIIKTDFHPQIMDKLFQLSFTYKIHEIIFSFFPNSSSSIFLQSYTWGLIWILYHHIMWFAFCNHYTM